MERNFAEEIDALKQQMNEMQSAMMDALKQFAPQLPP